MERFKSLSKESVYETESKILEKWKNEERPAIATYQYRPPRTTPLDPETGKCWDHSTIRLMGPGWFCCFAEPLKGERFSERDKIMKEKEKQK